MENTGEEQNSFDKRNDELEAENALIKLKLELDHGMQMSDFGTLDAEVRNMFLTNILEFEQKLKEHTQITVFKFLGSPDFPNADQLTQSQISAELERANLLMEEKGISLDCIKSYPDEEIYRFITERFFFEETNDFMMSGITWHFIYEEFLSDDRDDG